MVFANPHDTSVEVLRAGITKGELPWWQICLRGYFAGMFIAVGALFSLVVAGGLPGFQASDPGLVKLVFAFLFPTGLVLVAQTGAELFTGNIMFLTPGLLLRKISPKQVLKNWGLSYIFNFLGSLFVAFFLAYLSGLTTTGSVASYTASLSMPLHGVLFLRLSQHSPKLQ